MPKWQTLIEAENGGTEIVVTVPPKAMVLLTDDYEDRIPPEVENVVASENAIGWDAVEDSAVALLL